MALARYNAARDAIETMLRETRELIQNINVLSYLLKDGRTMTAQEWRHEVAYRALLLLRTTLVVIDYPVNHVLPWSIPELNGIEATDIRNSLLLASNGQQQRWMHRNGTFPPHYNGVWEEALRVPIRVEYLLRKSIHSHTVRFKEVIAVVQELKLFAGIDNFMNGYYSMRKFLTTVCCLATRLVHVSLFDKFRSAHLTEFYCFL
jgi:hypothetical protein